MIPAFKTTLGYVPKQGSRAISVKLPFNTNNVTQFSQDFALEQMAGELEFIQSIFVDNSLNAQPVSIRFSALEQVITVKAQTQGYYPIFVPNGRFSLTALSTGNVDVPIILSNVFINPSVWSVV